MIFMSQSCPKTGQTATKTRFHKESSNLRDALSLTTWPAQNPNARTHIAERSTLHA